MNALRIENSRIARAFSLGPLYLEFDTALTIMAQKGKLSSEQANEVSHCSRPPSQAAFSWSDMTSHEIKTRSGTTQDTGNTYEQNQCL